MTTDRTRRPAGPVLPVVCLSLATVVSAVVSLNVALPDMARDTGATLTELSWIIDAYALVFAALLLPGGALGDRFGRRRALIGGLALFAATASAALFVDSPTALIGVRALLGLGAAVIMPATLSTITATFDEADRVKGVAVWTGVAGASAILGLFASGLVMEWWSWRSVFALSVLLALVSLVATAMVVPESADPEHASRDPFGGLLSAAGMGMVVFSLIEAPTHGWTSGRTLVGIAVGLALLGAFALWELTRERPLLDPRHFAQAAFAGGTLSITVQFFTFFGFIYLLLQYFQLVLDLSPLEAAVRMLPLPLGLMPAARLSPHLVPRLGQARLCGLGLGVIALGMLGFTQVDAGTSYGWVAALLWPLGLGMGLAMTPATTAITDALPAAEQGVASAVNDLARELGGALGIAVLASVMTSSYRSALALPGALPEQARQLARDSFAAATQLPAPVPQLARDAFMTGMHDATRVASVVVACVGAVIVTMLARAARRSAAAQEATEVRDGEGHRSSLGGEDEPLLDEPVPGR
ncbi:MAG: MFS transporter [Nocardioidaceae bacterium]